MANTTVNKPKTTIGVDRYTFFKVKEETSDGITYETGVALPGTVEIAPTDSGGSDAFDADNGVYEITSYLEKIGHDITNADITPEVDAMWRGLTAENGLVQVGSVSNVPYFAVAWRVLKSDGSYRYVRFYKGQYNFASNVGGKTKPSSGAPDKQTAKANYTAAQRESDGMYYAYIDEGDIPAGTTREQFEESWFADPNYDVKPGE